MTRSAALPVRWSSPAAGIAFAVLLGAACGAPTADGESSHAPATRPAAPLSPPAALVPPDPATTFYISPSGSDRNDGRSAQAPFRTFARAWPVLPPGGTLLLLDGVYSESGTGTLGSSDRNAADPPSGKDEQRPTRVMALNPGSVIVDGPLRLGRKTHKASNVHVAGITFRGGGWLYNTSHVTVKDCGFHGPFTIGTNDHHEGNTRNLVEDVWIWASGERIIAINYRSHENVWRRVLVRGDGCGTAECRGSGNPNVGITVYDSRDVSLQNVMVVDRILAPGDEPYGDFAAAQHTGEERYFLGRCSWLGTLSLRSPDSGYYLEPDETLDPTFRLENAVAWDAAHTGFNLARAGTHNTLLNITARSLAGDAVRVAPALTSGSLRNVLVAGAGRYGINSAYPPSYANVHGSAEDAYNQTTCQSGCSERDPRGDGSLRHLTRIESGTFLNGRGAGGADIGANVVARYGVDGSRFGQAGYDTLTSVPLWPWPNEERIRLEMCANSGVTRGFCSAPSLTRYVWEYLGHALPQSLSGSAARPRP